jgi:hypothetical protein
VFDRSADSEDDDGEEATRIAGDFSPDRGGSV